MKTPYNARGLQWIIMILEPIHSDPHPHTNTQMQKANAGLVVLTANTVGVVRHLGVQVSLVG